MATHYRQKYEPNNLKVLRLRAKLSQATLSEKAGVYNTLVQTIEKSGIVPIQKNAEKLAEALGVSVVDIWPDYRDPHKPAPGSVRDRLEIIERAAQMLVKDLEETGVCRYCGRMLWEGRAAHADGCKFVVLEAALADTGQTREGN